MTAHAMSTAFPPPITSCYPMVTQVAMQQGRRAANNIAARARGTPQAFDYLDKAQVATVGRHCALVDGIRASTARVESHEPGPPA